MIRKLIKLSLLLISIQALSPIHIVFADTGPKPTMEFTFKQDLPEGELTIKSGILYECDLPDCGDAAPLRDLGPQGLYCDATSCRALAYGFAPYHKLKIEFSDGITRESNIFETAGFDSKYTATVRPDDLLVEAQFSLNILSPLFLIILVCVCILAAGIVIIGLIIFFVRRSAKQ